MKCFKKIALLTGTIAVLSGCGAESTTNVKVLPDPALTGQFVDSPVAGLGYRSESVTNGVTDENGEFSYFRGEQLTFYIGDLELPATAASSIITPLRVFATDSAFNSGVVNTLRLLQSLDQDGDPSNGITISSDAAASAQMVLAEGQTAADFFNRSPEEFAADVETWLANAGGSTSTLVPAEQAVTHFVDYLEATLGTLLPNSLDVSLFNGDVYFPLTKGSSTELQLFNFTPDDETGLSGTFVRTIDGVEINGEYHFAFGRRAIVLTSGEQTDFLIARSFNTVNQVYSLCVASDGATPLATLVQTCDVDEDKKSALLTFTEEQAEIELVALEELANSVEPALLEEFDTDTATFFSASYKRLSEEADAGPLFYKTGGSPVIDSTLGQLTLSGARFSIGNAASNPDKGTSANDTFGTGIYNISEGFTLSFDVVSHNSGGSLSLYIDNNSTSQGNSIHGAASKFYGFSINDENIPQGQRFSYTYIAGQDVVTGPDLTAPDARGVLNTSITNSFFQLRTDSSGTIVIDNLKIETVAGGVDVVEPEEPEEPEVPEVPSIPRVNLPSITNYIGVTEDMFSTAYQSLVDATGAEVPLYNRTGGSVAVVADGLELDSGRFTIGHATPGTDTTADDTSATGVFDLSRPYNVVMDIVSVSDPDGDNNFQIYVDNSTSSSSKSMHGGDSKFYSELINTLTPGTTLTVPGLVATKNSFIQLRTESGGKVVVNNLRIEYVNENILAEETFETTTELLFIPEYKSIPGNDAVAMFSITGGGSGLSITDGKLTLDSARFSWGNTTPDVETSGDDTGTSGIFDLSKPYNVIFDVLAIDDVEGNNNFQIYVDNNTSSSSKSIHGGSSKFYSSQILELTPGQTITVEGLLATETSFLQLRTESGGVVTIDNLRIEYIETNLVLAETFDTTVEEFFTAGYNALASDETKPMYNITGGGSGITITDGQITLDSARFSLGHTTVDVETSGEDTVTSGELDLSRPYTIMMDIISISDEEANNNFLVYVDNNTSSSSKSIHGGDSKFYSEQILSLTPGQTLTIEGFVATETSFLQLRTESGGIVTIDNLRIEYVEEEQLPAGVFGCSTQPELYFCDDFNNGSIDNWVILASSDNADGAIGYFDILNDEDKNNVLRYNAGGLGGELLLIKESAMANVPDGADYFVEARIRPRQNSTTANKQLYMMARYQSEGNWYAGGLNVQNSSSSTQVELAVTTDGSISRPVQKKSPILLGEKDGVDGVWYTVRFEMIGDALTVYLNGENMGTTNDSTYTTKGLIGLFTYNRSFEIDDVKVGDPSVKPIQLTLDYKEPSWETTTTTDPLVINVAALQNDGATVDTFVVSSNNPNVVSVSQDGGIVTLTPTGEGEATVTFVSGSDSSIVRTLNVSIASGFVMPSADYGSLSGLVTPMVSSISQHTDTSLSITFDSDITLGSLGEVRIYKMADDSIVDQLKVGTNVDVMSAPDKTRSVNYTPISIAEDGKTLLIDPRNDVLEYGESYYVVIGEDVVLGAQLNGTDFVGLGDNSDWSFTTKFTGPAGTDILVDDDGAADFRTLQGALTYIMNNVDKDAPATVSIKDGTYTEMLFLRNQNNITIQGESRENTIVQYDNYETFNGGSSGRPVFLVESADLLVLNNFTLKNSHIRDNAYSNQAEAIYFNSSYRLVANNMNFMSEQDTLLLKGYSWFYNSLVAGNVDFIWGYPNAALFENSEIRTIGDSKNGPSETPTSGGYILQSRTPVESDPGFVFLNGEFTNGPGPIGNTVADNSTYFARSSGKSDAFDNMILINNKIDTHIATVGWAVQGVNGQPAANPDMPTAAAGWREYGSMDMAGNLLDLSGRVGGFELIESEAASYSTREAVFSGYNSGAGWMPEPLGIPVIPVSPEEPVSTLMLSEDIDKGFAGNSFDITGGAGGMTVTVNTGAALQSALKFSQR